MPDQMDKASLFEAVAIFLNESLRPHVDDKQLAFRVLVTANLARIAADEIRNENENNRAELARLRSLMPDVALNPDIDQGAQVRQLNDVLAERIQCGDFPVEKASLALTHVMKTCQAKLAIENPSFETGITVA